MKGGFTTVDSNNNKGENLGVIHLVNTDSGNQIELLKLCKLICAISDNKPYFNFKPLRAVEDFINRSSFHLSDFNVVDTAISHKGKTPLWWIAIAYAHDKSNLFEQIVNLDHTNKLNFNITAEDGKAKGLSIKGMLGAKLDRLLALKDGKAVPIVTVTTKEKVTESAAVKASSKVTAKMEPKTSEKSKSNKNPKANVSGFTDEILSWSIDSLRNPSTDAYEDCFPRIPSYKQVTTVSRTSYFATFLPLILAECREMMRQGLEAVDEQKLKAVNLEFIGKAKTFKNGPFTINMAGELPKDFIQGECVVLLQNNKTTLIGLASPPPFKTNEDQKIQEIKVKLKRPQNPDLFKTGDDCSIYVLGPVVSFRRQFDVCTNQPALAFESDYICPSHSPSSKTESSSSTHASLESLNDSQREAVIKFSNLDQGLQLLQGPPGTGKTSTIVKLLDVLVDKNEKTLVCAPSNKAVQVIAKRAFKELPNIPMLIAGVEDKIPTELKPIYFDKWLFNRGNELKALIKKASDAKNVDNIKCRKKIIIELQNGLKSVLESLIKFQLIDVTHELNSTISEDIDSILSDDDTYFTFLRSFQREIMKLESILSKTSDETLLNNSSIVFTTLCVSGRTGILKMEGVTTLIIDEAAQTTEAETLIPFQHKPRKCLLVGDTNQLPAVVVSPKAKECHYDWSMMERLIEKADYPYDSLKTQYRMHPEIRKWPSKTYYNNNLNDGSNIKERQALPFPKILTPYSFINIYGKEEKDYSSFSNQKEAKQLVKVIAYLKANGINIRERVGIITFYEGQCKLINKTLQKNQITEIKASTVDSFQGDERDIILISFVRANNKGLVGFLKDFRRLNVAITRAKLSLIIFGNAATFLKSKSDIKSLIEDASKRGVYFEEHQLAKVLYAPKPAKEQKKTEAASKANNYPSKAAAIAQLQLDIARDMQSRAVSAPSAVSDEALSTPKTYVPQFGSVKSNAEVQEVNQQIVLKKKDETLADACTMN